MSNRHNVENDFRSVTREVQVEPVHWGQIQRRVRRRRLTVLGGVIMTAIVIAAAVIGIKVLVDPAYRVQLSSATAAVTFGKDHAELGSTQLGEYLHQSGASPVRMAAPIALREEGFVFDSTLDLVGLRHRALRYQWTLHSMVSGQQVPVAIYPASGTLRPSSNDATTTLSVWMSYPAKIGHYQVDFLLRDAKGQVLDESQSRQFKVLAPRIATSYEAPGYVALLPSGWKFVERYTPASPHRFVTRMTGPNGLSVLIDTTRHINGNPADSAKVLEALFRDQPTYRRVEFFPTNAVGVRAFEWSFEDEGIRKTDIFFYKGGDGYAVLAEGTPRYADEIRMIALRVGRSVESRDGEKGS